MSTENEGAAAPAVASPAADMAALEADFATEDAATAAQAVAALKASRGAPAAEATPVPEPEAPPTDETKPPEQLPIDFPKSPFAIPESKKPDEDAAFIARFRATVDAEQAKTEAALLKKQLADADSLFETVRKTGDIEPLLEKLNWTVQDFQKWLAGDRRAPVTPQMTAQEQRIAALEAKLAAADAAAAERTQAQQIDTYKSAIPKMIAGYETAHPYLAAYVESPEQLSEAIFGIISAAHSNGGVALTPAEAAKALDATLRQQAERFRKVLTQPGQNESKTSVPASGAPKPTAPALSYKQTTSPTPAADEIDDLDEAAQHAAAVAALKKARREAATA